MPTAPMSSQENTSPSTAVRVVLRPIGSPLTVGLSGLGIASLVESGFALGWVAAGEAREVGAILIAVPFVLQLLACIFSYLARDGAAGAAVGVLSTTWLALGTVHLIADSRARSGALGLLLVASGCALAVSASSVLRANRLAGAVFMLAALRFALAGVYELGAGGPWNDVAAIVGLAISGAVAYAVLAFELEGQQRRPVLPTFRHGRGRVQDGAAPGGEFDALVREPGVRQTS